MNTLPDKAKPLINGLQLSIRPRVKLTKGQKALLNKIKECVANSSTLDWEVVIQLYYNNIRQKYLREFNWSTTERTYMSSEELDVLEEYKKQSDIWKYTLRSLIRQWFLNTIGVLVLKNQLIIIPTIKLEEK